MTTLLAHISDLHLDGSPRARERTTRTLQYLSALSQRPDALLVTGDIADNHTAQQYREAALLLDLPFPVLTCPGNHDDRAAFRQHLLHQEPTTTPLNQVHDVAGTTVLVCDSTLPDHDGGHLDPQTLVWINHTLEELPSNTPALLAFHHPPVRVHHPLADSIGLNNAEDLAGLLHAHPQVAGILVGHAHTGGATTFAGRPLLLAPAVIRTATMPWDSERTAAMDQPPGVAFHLIDQDHRLTTHFRAVV